MDQSVKGESVGTWRRQPYDNSRRWQDRRPDDDRRPGAVIAVDPALLQEVLGYAEAAAGEWAALSYVDVEGGNLVVRGRLYIPRQTASAGAVDVAAADLADTLIELDKQGVDIDRLRCQIHSHGALSSFFSSTDSAQNLSMTDSPWAVQLVVNKNGELRGGMTQRDPVITWCELPVVMYVPPDVRRACADELAQKVTPYRQRTDWYGEGWDERGDTRQLPGERYGN